MQSSSDDDRLEVASSDNAGSEIANIHLGLFGIHEWTPGRRVEIRKRATLISSIFSSVAVTFVITVIGGNLGIGALNEYVFAIPNLWQNVALAVVCVLACSVVARLDYKPASRIELDWNSRSLGVQDGEAVDDHQFKEIEQLSLCGQYQDREPRYRKNGEAVGYYPERWRSWIEIRLRNRPALMLIEGFTKDAEEFGDDAPNAAYQELLEFIEPLASSLDVSWDWQGFDGDEEFQPPSTADAPASTSVEPQAQAALEVPIDESSETKYASSTGDIDLDQIDPNDVDSLIAVAKKWSERNRSGAIDLLTTGLIRHRDYADLYRERAHLYSMDNRTEDAIADFSRVIELEPEDAMAYEFRADALTNSNQYEAAIADYTKFLEVTETRPSSMNPVIWMSSRATIFAKRADAYLKSGQEKLGRSGIDAALDLDRSNPYALLLKDELSGN